jgi:hypothetical protein
MIKKIDPYYYEDAGPVVIDYIQRLESALEEYQAKDKIPNKKDRENLPVFKIKTEAFDLVRYDAFQTYKFPTNGLVYLAAILKVAKLFTTRKKLYNYDATLMMLYMYPLEYFRRDDVLKFCVHTGKLGRIVTGKRLHKLLYEGYVAYNKVKKSDQPKDWMWFITVKGKAAVRRFLEEVYNLEINIDIYDENFKRAIREAQGPRRKKYGFIRRHEAIFGERIPPRPKRKKPRDSDNNNLGQGEQTQS